MLAGSKQWLGEEPSRTHDRHAPGVRFVDSWAAFAVVARTTGHRRCASSERTRVAVSLRPGRRGGQLQKKGRARGRLHAPADGTWPELDRASRGASALRRSRVVPAERVAEKREEQVTGRRPHPALDCE